MLLIEFMHLSPINDLDLIGDNLSIISEGISTHSYDTILDKH
jgi:hypothetical protein